MRDYVLLHPHSFERKRGIMRKRERERERERRKRKRERERESASSDARSSRKFSERMEAQKKRRLTNGCVYNLKGLHCRIHC